MTAKKQNSYSCKLFQADARGWPRCTPPDPPTKPLSRARRAACASGAADPAHGHETARSRAPGCRSRSAELSGNLRKPSVKSACFVGQWAQTAHMLPTHITSHLGNAHILQAFISPFFPVGLVREISLPAHIPSQKTHGSIFHRWTSLTSGL